MNVLPTPTPSPVLPARALQAAAPPRPRRAHRAAVIRAAFAPGLLGDDCVDLLVNAAVLRRVGPGELDLGHPGHPPSWWLLVQGRATVGHAQPGGKLVESRRVRPGEWLDVASAWAPAPSTETVVCSHGAVLWGLRREVLAQCCSADPEFVHAMGQVMAGHLHRMAADRHALTTQNVLARVAAWLCRRLPASAAAGVSFRLQEQKQFIARELVMAQETLSRCLRQLINQGCIAVQGLEITVLDLAGLRHVAGLPGHPAQGLAA